MQHLINKIIKFLKSKPSSFFQFKKIHGRTTGFFKGDHIELDFRKDLVQSTIHECLHAINPDWSETKVIKLEKAIVKEITNIQVATILQILARKIKHTEINQSYLKRE
jgi:hypothetical protein